MAQKTVAQLTTDDNALITSQTAPDSITPTIDGGERQDIIDSFWNRLDNPMPNGDTDVDALGDFLASLQTQINSLSILTGMTNPYLFRATKTITQTLPISTSGPFTIIFEDDSTAPNYDNSNLFYSTEFIPTVAGNFTFALEKVAVKNVSGADNNDKARIRILKNNVEIATTALLFIKTSTDSYGNIETDASGYVFDPLIASGVALAVGDIVTAEVVVSMGSGSIASIIAGVFSNAQNS